MSYREAIPKSIRETVASWGLDPALHRLLWEALRSELRSRDESEFGRSVAPVRCLILPISVAHPETGLVRNFCFYIDPWVREGERTVIYARDLDVRPDFKEVSTDVHAAPKPTFEP